MFQLNYKYKNILFIFLKKLTLIKILFMKIIYFILSFCFGKCNFHVIYDIGEKMLKDNYKKSKFIVAMLIVFVGSLFFVGCKKQFTVEISVVDMKSGYNINNINENQEIEENSPYEVFVNAESGYSLDNIVVKANGNVLVGTVTANVDGGEQIVTDETGYLYSRTWKSTIRNITSDTLVSVNLTNCNLIQHDINVGGFDENVYFAKSKISPNDEATTFSLDTITAPVQISNNLQRVGHGEKVYLFLDENTTLKVTSSNGDLMQVTSLKKFGDVPYIYNNQYAYYLGEVTKPLSISKVTNDETNFTLNNYEKLATIGFCHETDEPVSLHVLGDSLNNSSLTSLSGSGFFFYSFLYLGNKENFAQEQIETNINTETLNSIGKQIFYRLIPNENLFGETAVSNIADFYLVDDIFKNVENLTPLAIKNDLTSSYLEINKADILPYVEDDKATLFIKTVVKDNVLGDYYVGFEQNYVGQDTNIELQIQNEFGTTFFNYVDFTSSHKTFKYFLKSKLFNNNEYLNTLKVLIGNDDGMQNKPYLISAKIDITSNIDESFSKTQNISYENSNSYFDTISINDLSLFQGKNIFKIDIDTTFESYDTAMHQINFDHLFENGELSPKIYISNNLTNPNWIELKQENLTELNSLTISSYSPLYYYIDETSTNLPFNLVYENNIVSNTSYVYDIFGNSISFSQGGQYKEIHAMYLPFSYIIANAELTAMLLS